jgi:hypothetical protein
MAGTPAMLELGASLSEVGLHELQRLISHVEAGVEAQRVHLRAGRRSDAMESANRQGLDEHRALLGRDGVLAIRLAMIGGELSQKLVVRDAGGRIQAGDVLDLGADWPAQSRAHCGAAASWRLQSRI